MSNKTKRLRELLNQDVCHTVPNCWDAMSAKMIEDAGFPFVFMSGFSVSVSRIGQPDLGLISYGEMLDQGRNICAAVDISVIGDGDTGYGNSLNVERTVKGYIQAGFSAIMIEDQVAPKRCGHTQGKLVVDRGEALDRIRAAVHARDESEDDILILARTDSRGVHGLDEALWRAQRFAELGADILFIEAPENEEELAIITKEVPAIHMVNMLEGGKTPILQNERLQELGYRFATYPLTLLSSSLFAMKQTLEALAKGEVDEEHMFEFSELRKLVGFDAYYEDEKRYSEIE